MNPWIHSCQWYPGDTPYGVSPVQCKKKFGIACLGKKLVFHTENCEFRK